MRIFTIKREQWIPWPVDEVFAFFADADNLEVITPAWLRFRILGPGPKPLGAGALIAYRLRWRGLPLRWVTEIEEWEPPLCFVDVQRRGPYALWHHTHAFEAYRGGTLMRDEVRYALPLGPLGRLMHRLAIRRDLERIFAYRAVWVSAVFGGGADAVGGRGPAIRAYEAGFLRPGVEGGNV